MRYTAAKSFLAVSQCVSTAHGLRRHWRTVYCVHCWCCSLPLCPHPLAAAPPSALSSDRGCRPRRLIVRSLPPADRHRNVFSRTSLCPASSKPPTLRELPDLRNARAATARTVLLRELTSAKRQRCLSWPGRPVRRAIFPPGSALRRLTVSHRRAHHSSRYDKDANGLPTSSLFRRGIRPLSLLAVFTRDTNARVLSLEFIASAILPPTRSSPGRHSLPNSPHIRTLTTHHSIYHSYTAVPQPSRDVTHAERITIANHLPPGCTTPPASPARSAHPPTSRYANRVHQHPHLSLSLLHSPQRRHTMLPSETLSH